MIQYKNFLLLISALLFSLFQLQAQGCLGLAVDAGPDLFACKLPQSLQLQGSTMGMVTKYYWTPAAGLSNPNVLNPFVTAGPGKYKFTLVAEGTSDINLIVNGDFEGGATGFTTEYVWGFPGGGFGPNNIAVDVNPQAYNSGFPPCPDHTSGSGNQLIVDGSTVAGRKVWCQTVNVSPGKTYLFQFFVQSVYPVSPAQLSASVDGNAIGSITAGANCNWLEFNACFTATKASILICIEENSGVGFGNDFALDDLGLFEKCEVKDEVEVEIVDIKSALNIDKIPKCASDEFILDGSLSSSGINITYEWSTDIGNFISKNGNQAKAKGAGSYKLKVIYDNGSIHCEDEVEVIVQVANDLFSQIDVIGMPTCDKDTVQLNVMVDNGSGNYIYSWSPANKILGGQGTPNAIVTEAGIYTIKAIDRISGCEVVQQQVLLADTLTPISVITGDTLLNCVRTNISLFASPIDTNKYKITWIKPDQSKLLNLISINTKIPGIYTLVVEDRQNNCRDSVDWFVEQDTLVPLIELGKDLVIDCINNSVTLTPTQSQNSGNEKYFWKINGVDLVGETQLNSKTINQSSKVFLHIQDTVNGCEFIDSINVNDIRKIPTAEAGNSATLNCLVSQIVLNGTGTSTQSARIQWTTNSGQIISGQNSLNPTVNKPGWYYIFTLDSTNYCNAIDSVLILEDKTNPQAILGADFTFTCADTIALIDASNSSSGNRLLYKWSTTNGSIVSGQNSTKLWVKSAGIYELIVLDSINGCADTAQIMITPDQNSPVATARTLDTLDCVTKSVDLLGIASSNSGNALTYQWTSLDGFQIQNANTLNPKVSNPGTYVLFVLDQVNGCSTLVQTSVLIDTLSPKANAGQDLIWNCDTKSLDLNGNASSGSNNLNFVWSTTNGIISNNPNNSMIKIGSPGDYRLQIIDAINGCEDFDLIRVNPDQNFPSPAIDPADTLTCVKTQIYLSGINSIPRNQLSFKWSTLNGSITGPSNVSDIQISKPGFYVLEVTDTINHCMSMDTIVVFENIIKPTVDAGTDLELTCKLKALNLNAKILSSAPNAIVNWTTRNGNIQSNPNSLNPAVDKDGIYVITIIDPVNGCTNTDSIQVSTNQNVPTNINFLVEQPKCPGDVGAISISQINGGVSPFEIFIDGNKIAGTRFDFLQTGNHDLKIVDSNGCDLLNIFSISQPVPTQVDIVALVKLTSGENYSLLPVYSIPDDSIAWVKWEPADFLSCADCLYPEVKGISRNQNYTVSFANKNGCIATASIRFELLERNVWHPNVFSPNGDKVNDHFNSIVTENSYSEIRSMQIFNRWGDLVFKGEHIQPNNPEDGWDGRWKGENASPGVYVYYVELIWKNGESARFTGDLTLIR